MPCSSTTLGIRASRTTSSHRLLGGGGSLPATTASVFSSTSHPEQKPFPPFNLALRRDENPALVAAPCRGLREVGVAVIALAANPPTGTDAGTSTARLLAQFLAFSMGTDAGTSTARLLAHIAPLTMVTEAGTSTLLAHTANPPTGTDAGTSTARLLATTLAFSMRTQLPNIFRFLLIHELEGPTLVVSFVEVTHLTFSGEVTHLSAGCGGAAVRRYKSVYDQTSKLLVTKLFWRRGVFSRFAELHVTKLFWRRGVFSRFAELHVTKLFWRRGGLLQICRVTCNETNSGEEFLLQNYFTV